MGFLFYGPLGSCVLSLLNVGLAYVQVQVYKGHAKDSAQSVLDLRFLGWRFSSYNENYNGNPQMKAPEEKAVEQVCSSSPSSPVETYKVLIKP